MNSCVRPDYAGAPVERATGLAPGVLRKVQIRPQERGQVSTLLGDTGYFGAANVKACEAQAIEPVLSMKRESHHMAVLQRFAPDAPGPETDDPTIR